MITHPAYNSYLELRELFKKHAPGVSVSTSTLDFAFSTDELATKISTFLDDKAFSYRKQGHKVIILDKKQGDTIIFVDTLAVLDRLSNKIELLDSNDLFVLNLSADYLYYEHLVKVEKTGGRLLNIFNHFTQYHELLKIYNGAENVLFEAKKSLLSNEQFVIVSKGEDKHFTSVTYKAVDERIFSFDLETLKLQVFSDKIQSSEWLACYNNNVCKFMELQAESNRTFATLYGNFNFLIEQTDRNYQLFLDKFSFNTIKQQYKNEKTSYFDALGNAQTKIAAQIISIPVSLGVTILGFYKFNDNKLTLILIYVSILIYSVFIATVILLNIFDVNKLGKDVKEEEKRFERHYPDLYSGLKDDFRFMLKKRRHLRFLAYSMLVALFISIALTTIFLIFYKQQPGEVLKIFHLI